MPGFLAPAIAPHQGTWTCVDYPIGPRSDRGGDCSAGRARSASATGDSTGLAEEVVPEGMATVHDVAA